MKTKTPDIKNVALQFADIFADFVMCGDLSDSPEITQAIRHAEDAIENDEVVSSIKESIALLKKFIKADVIYLDERIESAFNNAKEVA